MGPCGASRFIPVDSAFGIDLVQNLLKMYVKVATSRCSVVWEYLNSYQLIGKKTNQELFVPCVPGGVGGGVHYTLNIFYEFLFFILK